MSNEPLDAFGGGSQAPQVETVDSLSMDALFDLLGDEQRRYVLYYLRNGDTPVDLDSLAGTVARWEQDAITGDVSPDLRRRIRAGLHHTHLPRLEDHGIVEYDSDENTVDATGTVEQLGPFLDLAADRDFA